MTATAMLMKEIEALPEECAGEVLDFVLFLRAKKANNVPRKMEVKSMFGVFPGISTDVEREDMDRI
jgi:hypothetical protein